MSGANIIVRNAANILRNRFSRFTQIDEGHGIGHALRVLNLSKRAILYEKLTTEQSLCVQLAALLHDAEDEKFFPGGDGIVETIVEKCAPEMPEINKTVSLMISWVSTSKNGNKIPEDSEPWMLIPRWCDRLEAIGNIGILRCYQYSIKKGMMFRTKSTPSIFNMEQLKHVAPKSRYESYVGKSDSMIDHYYDKLVHIGLDSSLCGNKFLLQESEKRMKIIYKFLFDLAKNGNKIDVVEMEALEEKERKKDEKLIKDYFDSTQ